MGWTDFFTNADLKQQLTRIENLIVKLTISEEANFMATLQNFKDLLNGVKTETDRIAAKMDDPTIHSPREPR